VLGISYSSWTFLHINSTRSQGVGTATARQQHLPFWRSNPFLCRGHDVLAPVQVSLTFLSFGRALTLGLHILHILHVSTTIVRKRSGRDWCVGCGSLIIMSLHERRLARVDCVPSAAAVAQTFRTLSNKGKFSGWTRFLRLSPHSRREGGRSAAVVSGCIKIQGSRPSLYLTMSNPREFFQLHLPDDIALAISSMC
jgi:hypothetical protein